MIALILGSGPNVVTARDWPREAFDRIVAINNAWRVRPDWDDLIYPEDFPPDRQPDRVASHQRRIEAAAFVPAQNAFGGFVYAGGTMAFTAGYWALHALRPRILAFMGCDMTYEGQKTHFYGRGEADPLRADITLRSLEAKSARLMALAAREGCACLNLSSDPSRLVFPRASLASLPEATPAAVDERAIEAALAEEARLDYRVPSGRYWEEAQRFDPARIDALDRLWAATVPQPK